MSSVIIHHSIIIIIICCCCWLLLAAAAAAAAAGCCWLLLTAAGCWLQLSTAAGATADKVIPAWPTDFRYAQTCSYALPKKHIVAGPNKQNVVAIWHLFAQRSFFFCLWHHTGTQMHFRHTSHGAFQH